MKLLTVRQIYVDSFTKFIIKAHIPYLSHLKALSVQRYSQRKRAHRDCPSDSEKIPHGDTLS